MPAATRWKKRANEAEWRGFGKDEGCAEAGLNEHEEKDGVVSSTPRGGAVADTCAGKDELLVPVDGGTLDPIIAALGVLPGLAVVGCAH